MISKKRRKRMRLIIADKKGILHAKDEMEYLVARFALFGESEKTMIATYPDIISKQVTSTAHNTMCAMVLTGRSRPEEVARSIKMKYDRFKRIFAGTEKPTED